MIGDFTFENPTKLIFGEHSLEKLAGELEGYGPNVLLVYGGGSIKRNGIYDAVMEQLAAKNVTEFPGVKSNPTAEILRDAADAAKACDADFVLAVGGGSVCDLAKAAAAAKGCPEDPWVYFYEKNLEPQWEMLPVGCVLTMAATGSEMNSIAVMMNTETKEKKGHHFLGPSGYPRFSILNPRFTMSLPKYQMVSGIFDTFNHITEQYFAGEEPTTSDYMMEGLMRSVIDNGLKALEDPYDYQVRSDLMWAATWALNDLFKVGNILDFRIHKIGQTIAVFTDAAHGMSLSAVSMAYYRHMMPYGLPRFVRFARHVWGIEGNGMTDEQLAEAGLAAMGEWMKKMGVAMSISEIGVTEDMVDEIAEATPILDSGYKRLTTEEIKEILRESL